MIVIGVERTSTSLSVYTHLIGEVNLNNEIYTVYGILGESFINQPIRSEKQPSLAYDSVNFGNPPKKPCFICLVKKIGTR